MAADVTDAYIVAELGLLRNAAQRARERLLGRLPGFGDQIGDMATIVANTRAGREQAMAPYLGWIGERWFVLPNPTYGSWEPALFDNAWSLPEAERRERKLRALDYTGAGR